jgi:hypothetical protein
MTTTDQALETLTKFGSPTVCKTKYGWWCYITLNVSLVGVNIEVQSCSKSSTPQIAVNDCLAKVKDILKELSKTTEQQIKLIE